MPDLVLHCCVLHNVSERQECAGNYRRTFEGPVACNETKRRRRRRIRAFRAWADALLSVHSQPLQFRAVPVEVSPAASTCPPMPAQSIAWKRPFPDQCLTYFYGGRLTHCRCIRKRPALRLLRVLVARRGRDCTRITYIDASQIAASQCDVIGSFDDPIPSPPSFPRHWCRSFLAAHLAGIL